MASAGRSLPGARETLTALARHPWIHQSVLTGNLREVARVKLDVFGLNGFLDLDSGAYGDDSPERPKLVAIAQRRAARRTGATFDNNRTVLIGDTPKDVEAGLAAGVRVIAVATGETTVDELRTAGAMTVLGELDSQAVFEALEPDPTS